MTGTVSINENGDRSADYALLDMDPDSGEFRVSQIINKLNAEIRN